MGLRRLRHGQSNGESCMPSVLDAKTCGSQE